MVICKVATLYMGNGCLWEVQTPYERVACIKYSWFLVAMHAVNAKTERIG